MILIFTLRELFTEVFGVILWHCREENLSQSLAEHQEEVKKAAAARYCNSSSSLLFYMHELMTSEGGSIYSLLHCSHSLL